MRNPRTSLVQMWILPLTLVSALACNRGGGDISSGGKGPGSGGPGSGSGVGTQNPGGVGWWTMPPANPGTGIGGTPTGGGQNGGTGSGGPGSTGGGSTGGGSTGSLPVNTTGGAGAPMTPHLPGGGVASNTGLAPGCTPASANECPTITGACATGAGANVTVTKFGTLCLEGMGQTFSLPATTIEYIAETTNGQSYYRFRVTFNPNFVDNTYGAHSVGWPPVRGHRYGDLVKSDHTELQLFNGAGQLSLHFKMDYITADPSKSCGYGTLGVKGGEGTVLVGNPAYILAVGTSLDRNLNACGYCKSPACNGDCTIDSPATDANFTTNPMTPNWDFRVSYDVWIAPEAFGASGFGKANISYVHASPAKGGSDTLTTEAKPCPPNWNNPYPSSGSGAGGSSGGGTATGGSSGGGVGGATGGSGTGGTTGSGGACPINYTEYLTSEGKSTCVPNPTGSAGSGYMCPINWMLFITSEGKATCIPAPTPISGGTGGGTGGSGGGAGSDGKPVPVGPGNSCPINYEVYVSSEGRAICLPTNLGGTGTGSGGSTGGGTGGTGGGGGNVPINPDGTCPAGYKILPPLEGAPSQCAPISGSGAGGSSGGTGAGGGSGSGSGSGGGGGSGSGLMCPVDWTLYLTSEGQYTCTPTPRGGACPIDWTSYLTSEGKTTCVPTPRNGVCPEGYHYDVTSEGKYCL